MKKRHIRKRAFLKNLLPTLRTSASPHTYHSSHFLDRLPVHISCFIQITSIVTHLSHLDFLIEPVDDEWNEFADILTHGTKGYRTQNAKSGNIAVLHADLISSTVYVQLPKWYELRHEQGMYSVSESV